jgi:hypothetical protein
MSDILYLFCLFLGAVNFLCLLIVASVSMLSVNVCLHSRGYVHGYWCITRVFRCLVGVRHSGSGGEHVRPVSCSRPNPRPVSSRQLSGHHPPPVQLLDHDCQHVFFRSLCSATRPRRWIALRVSTRTHARCRRSCCCRRWVRAAGRDGDGSSLAPTRFIERLQSCQAVCRRSQPREQQQVPAVVLGQCSGHERRQGRLWFRGRFVW